MCVKGQFGNPRNIRLIGHRWTICSPNSGEIGTQRLAPNQKDRSQSHIASREASLLLNKDIKLARICPGLGEGVVVNQMKRATILSVGNEGATGFVSTSMMILDSSPL